ncbi:hypothetical protein RB594_002068 [Gaeumannomyces avenae]
MAREGTRSATGNSKPRVFPVVDTAPTITRKKTTKPKPAAAHVTKTKPAPGAKSAKPAGVTKRKATPKAEGPVTKKTATGKVEGKLEKVVKVFICTAPRSLITAARTVCARDSFL